MIDVFDHGGDVANHLGIYSKKNQRKYFPRSARPHGSKDYYNLVCKCISDGFYAAFGDTNVVYRKRVYFSDNNGYTKRGKDIVIKPDGRLNTTVNFEMK